MNYVVIPLKLINSIKYLRKIGNEQFSKNIKLG
jgi:hypothetical protein